MRLHDLLGAVDVLDVHPASSRADPDIRDLVHDSRRATPGALFCCIPGRATDGHDHAEAAVRAGAVALLVERALPLDVPQALVARVRAAIGPLAARFHGRPSEAMTVLGVTGTNGKTTVTYMVDAIAGLAGRRSAVIGTTGVLVAGPPGSGAETRETGFTTPEATDLQAHLAALRDEGVEIVAMEVSSHALAEHRVDGTRFAAAGLTNLGRDHLDLHGTTEAYHAAKARLFTPGFTSVAIVNADAPPIVDRDVMPRTYEYSAQHSAGGTTMLRADEIADRVEGVSFVMHDDVALGDDGRWSEPVRLAVPGRFNVENALCAAGLALAVDTPADAVVAGLEAFAGVPGRMERIDPGGPFTVYVDYAHTPDGLVTVLDAVRATNGAGRVIALFGCGGDRDPDKREPMGRAVGSRADLAVLTSDNPRSEDPAAIAAAAERGLAAAGVPYEVELDRRLAIRRALRLATPGDVVLVLGKGSETGQTRSGVTTPFDDRTVVREELEGLEGPT